MLPQERDLQYIGSLLDGMPVVMGDRVRVTLFSSRSADFQIDSTNPEGPVLIDPTTQLMIGEVKPMEVGPAISYEDIGGLKAQLQRVREMIELPLRFPEVFERLGIEPPKGVLLYGSPGCGKTLIARAVARETRTSFHSISGPEIIHKFYGESEAHLRTIFEQAAGSAPSIIFLDEIDAIAPRREKTGGEVEKRVVAQLLALMDGLAKRDQVIVIAATNLPNAIDPALRRPGRFDREISIPVPDRGGRLQILEIHSHAMPLLDDVDLGHLADVTHGFVGADLEALCREAAMSRLRKILPDIDFSLAQIPYDELARLEVGMEDFLAALREVQPSALREVTVEVPRESWDSVGGLASVKERLASVFDWPLRHPELFRAADVRPARGILFHGLPGCGKTLLARALASESGVNFISIKGPELLSMYVGESEERVRGIFRTARQASPSIVFFDEIDAVLPARNQDSGAARTAERVLSQFLVELDGIEELKDVLVLGATNRLDLLDAALLRPGRFDEIIEIPPPDENARAEIFAVHLRDKPVTADLDLATLAARTDGASGAEIDEICRRAALLAIARLLNESDDTPDVEALRVEVADLEQALAEVRPKS
jgi:transitional endoplasmic reticulum ATPase